MDIMDVASLSMTLRQSELMGDIGTAMLAKTMGTSIDLAEGAVDMLDSAALERSVNPAVGGNIDVSV